MDTIILLNPRNSIKANSCTFMYNSRDSRRQYNFFFHTCILYCENTEIHHRTACSMTSVLMPVILNHWHHFINGRKEYKNREMLLLITFIEIKIHRDYSSKWAIPQMMKLYIQPQCHCVWFDIINVQVLCRLNECSWSHIAIQILYVTYHMAHACIKLWIHSELSAWKMS